MYCLSVRGVVVELETYEGRASRDFEEKLFMVVQAPSALLESVFHANSL